LTPCASEVITSELNKPSGTRPEDSKRLKDRLTTREREVVLLLAEGKSTKEVASILGISVAETHRANIMRKLELHRVSDLVRYAVRNRIVEA
jgi:DNA-binding NarL/FixJ family response regulator